jgi:hypothetical protein
MSYKRDQRRKRQRREQPTEPAWGRMHVKRGRDVQITYHPLAGLRLRSADTTAHLRKFRDGHLIVGEDRIAVTEDGTYQAKMTLAEAADKINVEYGDAMRELADQ